MDNLQPELRDILEMVHRFNATHKDGCFIFNFVGFKKDLENKCEECGDYCECIDLNRSIIGAYGDLDTLRILSEEIRDLIEDNVEEDGFVNV